MITGHYPGAILLGYLYDQIFQGLVDAWATQGLALRGAIEFLRH
jgi:hypothetical protein